MRTVQWQGVCQGDEWEANASARSQPARRLDGLLAFGEQRCRNFEFTWQLSTTASWAGDRLDLRLVGIGEQRRRLNRTLLLERTADGWESRAWTNEPADEPANAGPPPGLPVSRFTVEAQDIVIDACPMTHWAPIRRLGLGGPRLPARRGGLSRPLAVAFPVLRVQLPTLAVALTRQRYAWVTDSGPNRVLTHAYADGPGTALTVDASGVPIEFGGLTRRFDTAMVA